MAEKKKGASSMNVDSSSSDDDTSAPRRGTGIGPEWRDEPLSIAWCLKSFEKSTPAPPVSRTEAGQSTSAMAVTCSSTSESPPSTSDSHSEAKSEGRANRGRRVQLGKRGAKGKIGKGLKCKNRRIASSSSSSLSPETEGSIDSSPESYRDKPHLVDFIRKPRPPKDSSTFPK